MSAATETPVAPSVTESPFDVDGLKPINTVREAATFTNMCEATIRNRVADGTLKSFRIGRSVRITRGAILEFLANCQAGE